MLRILLSLVIACSAVQAQLRLDVINGLDTTRYPFLAVKVRCTRNGLPYGLDTNNVLVSGAGFSIRPHRVSPINIQDGVVLIEWMVDNRLSTARRATLLTWDQNASASAIVLLPRLPVLRWLNSRAEPIEELRFGNVAREGATLTVYLQLQQGRYDQRVDLPVRIDSIVSSSPVFRVEWVGWIGNPRPLPSNVQLSLLYQVRIHSVPPDTSFQSGTITVYYDGGLRWTVPVTCNTFSLPHAQRLQFLSPRGGDLLAPCSHVTVRWKGMSEGTAVRVEYSLDSGMTWNEIGVTTDSWIEWTVPNSPTERLVFRVRELDALERKDLLDDGNSAPVARLRFRVDGRRLLSVHASNVEIVEWDVQNKRVQWRYMPKDIVQGKPLWVSYIDTTRVVVIYSTGQATYGILLDAQKEGIPLWEGQISERAATAVSYDEEGGIFALLTEPIPVVDIFSLSGNTFMRTHTLSLPLPASTLTFGAGKLIVALYDSRIVVYRRLTWDIERELIVPFVPRIALCSLLPDGRRLAVGCYTLETSVIQGFSAPVFLFDLPTAQLVRSHRRASTTPVAVTASIDARYLVFGFRAQPQTPIWDLAYDAFVGQVNTHTGMLADVTLSPDQRWAASATQTQPIELVLRTFIFPETIVGPLLRIGSVDLKPDTLVFRAVYAYTQVDTTFRARFCNKGTVALPLSQMWIEGAPIFQLVGSMSDDTLIPGECVDVSLRFAPPRAGAFTGNLVVSHCGMLHRIALRAVGLERTIDADDTIDVGTACVGTTTSIRHFVLVNRDPASLPVQGVSIYDAFRSPFRLLNSPRDTIVDGHSALAVTIEFSPRSYGTLYGTLYVTWGNRDNTLSIVLKGMGLGKGIQPHVAALAFIPEEPVRTVRLRNIDDVDQSVVRAWIEPTGGFTLLGTLPLTIPRGDSALLYIEHTVGDSIEALLVIETQPCGTLLRIPLVQFHGSAELVMPELTADSRHRSAIPIMMRFHSNYPYGDSIRCILRVAMHPRLYLPDTVWTRYGRARILSSIVEGDRRIATIEVVHVIGSQGRDTLATTDGFAALGEQDTSHLELLDAPFWGRAVSVTRKSGLLSLTGLCGQRRIVQNRIVNMSISPQPIDGDIAVLTIESSVVQEGLCRFYSTAGIEVLRSPLFVPAGKAEIPVNVKALDPGFYLVIVESSQGSAYDWCLVVR